MHYVYMLRSQSKPIQTYIGFTDDLCKRMRDHNAGSSPHTAKSGRGLWSVTSHLPPERKPSPLSGTSRAAPGMPLPSVVCGLGLPTPAILASMRLWTHY
jgi:hypothetical protein